MSAIYANAPLPVDQPCFRLLHLDSDSLPDKPLAVRLETYPLPTELRYEALSYCWGNGQSNLGICVNGESLLITEELAAALAQWRDDEKVSGDKVALWVDAVCIDQSNSSEKSHQVEQMKEIYANASRVKIWLGRLDTEASLAFRVLRSFAIESGAIPNHHVGPGLADNSKSVASLLSRPYFERIWIVQEVVVAKSPYMQCGCQRLNFDSFQVTLRQMTASGYLQFDERVASLAYIGDWRQLYHGVTQQQPTLYGDLDLRLFIDSRDRRATDQRDKIFSLRGLVIPELASLIEVDYGKPVNKVYTDFTKSVLNTRQDLQILSAVELEHRASPDTLKDLPSYVPDFSKARYGSGLLQRYHRFKPECFFRASGLSSPSISIAEKKVAIKGFQVDQVCRVTDVLDLGHGSIREKLMWLSYELYETRDYLFTGEPAWLTTFRTWTADRTALSPRIREGYKSQFFRNVPSNALACLSSPITPDLSSEVWTQIAKGMGNVMGTSVMFVTGKGYIGRAHSGIRKGDRLCIFFGGEVPYLIRDNDNHRFEFLCETYVHGLMDGEAMQQANTGQNRYFELI